MEDDPFFTGFDKYVYSYSSGFSGANYKINELVEDMRTDLDAHEIFQKHKKVIFLCHSMGGIVVRAFLIGHQALAPKVPMIYFFATPTSGADVARIAKVFSANPQLKGLVPLESNDYLDLIQNNWRSQRFLGHGNQGYGIWGRRSKPAKQR